MNSCLSLRRLHIGYERRSNRQMASLPKQLAEATAIAEGAWQCERQAAAAAIAACGAGDDGEGGASVSDWLREALAAVLRIEDVWPPCVLGCLYCAGLPALLPGRNHLPPIAHRATCRHTQQSKSRCGLACASCPALQSATRGMRASCRPSPAFQTSATCCPAASWPTLCCCGPMPRCRAATAPSNTFGAITASLTRLARSPAIPSLWRWLTSTPLLALQPPTTARREAGGVHACGGLDAAPACDAHGCKPPPTHCHATSETVHSILAAALRW